LARHAREDFRSTAEGCDAEGYEAESCGAEGYKAQGCGAE
jgi:hypothetical protein